MRQFILTSMLLLASVLTVFPVTAAYATCSNPAGNERDFIYNQDYHVYQFCNGTRWVMAGIPTDQFATTLTTTGPYGYFVMSNGTWNGNLGDLSGADSKCLTDLTTNTGWKGYSDANVRGLLTSGNVHAFLCNGSTCNNLNASASYLFADANNSGNGGASFTTDGSGVGPNDYCELVGSQLFRRKLFLLGRQGPRNQHRMGYHPLGSE